MDNERLFIRSNYRREAMKQKIEELIVKAVETLKAEGILGLEITPHIAIERTRDSQHGDFASNLALMLAKPAKANPRELAIKIIAALPRHEAISVSYTHLTLPTILRV